jgi:hypothetical protein
MESKPRGDLSVMLSAMERELPSISLSSDQKELKMVKDLLHQALYHLQKSIQP